MNLAKKVVGYAMCCALGIALMILGCTGTADSFWSGMGTGIVSVCALRFIQIYRLSKNEAYREKVQTNAADERNRFLRSKAWAWAGYLFVLIAAITAIVLRVLGETLLSLAASYAVLLLVALYWIAYGILRKKY